MGATPMKAFANGSPFEPSLDEFRAAMRELAGAVSVISCGQDERRTGFTATSVSSLSLEPPTLIISVNRASSSWPVLREAPSFGVNILSTSHRDLAHRFDELKRGLGIATNVLTVRLKRLTDAGILERRAYQEHPPRFEYTATAKGRDLYPVLIALLQWGDRYMRDASDPSDAPPRVVVHDTCGHAIRPAFSCPHCRSEVSAQNARTVARAELPRELRNARSARAPRRKT